MADEFGLLPTGFSAKTSEDVRASLVEKLKAKWGASYDLTDGSPDGQLVSIVASELGLVWAAALDLYSQLSRDTATGVGLDAALALTGTLREEAAPSSVTLLLVGDDATEVAAESRVSAASTETLWRLPSAATLAAVPAWASGDLYETGDLVTDAGNVYRRVNGGGGGLGDGPNDDPANLRDAGDLTNTTSQWELLGEGDAAVEASAVSVDDGPVVGTAYDLSVIETPITGWTAAWNFLDATLGTDEATDAEARIAGEEDLFRPAATTKDAIRQTLLRLEDVTAVNVFQNVTDTTDGDGVPPHAIECLVRGGTDQLIIDTIGSECAAAGIATYGNTNGTWTDSEGTDHAIEFSRPTELPIYVIVTLVKVAHDDDDPDSYPSDGDAQVKEAIATWGNSQKSGKNVVASGISAQAFGVAGVLDVTSVLISNNVDPPTVSTTIAVSLRQLAVFDTTRITVNTSNGTP